MGIMKELFLEYDRGYEDGFTNEGQNSNVIGKDDYFHGYLQGCVDREELGRIGEDEDAFFTVSNSQVAW